MFDLSGQVALVTGATGGIGQAIASILAQHEAEVMLTGTRTEVLEDLAKKIGPKAHFFPSDLKDSEALKKLVLYCETTLGKVDILVNNAGITQDNLALRMKPEEWTEVLEVNLTSVFQLTQRVLKGMVKRRYGRIINITSVVGVTGNAGQANYAASKAGMIGMSKSLALELASRHITVNCVAPGFIESPMTYKLSEEQKTAVLGRIPVERFGTPQDIAVGILYLASHEAQYVTGQTLHINGGMALC